MRITAWDAMRVDIDRGTAFEPPTVACDKACLGATERRRQRMTVNDQERESSGNRVAGIELMRARLRGSKGP